MERGGIGANGDAAGRDDGPANFGGEAVCGHRFITLEYSYMQMRIVTHKLVVPFQTW